MIICEYPSSPSISAIQKKDPADLDGRRCWANARGGYCLAQFSADRICSCSPATRFGVDPISGPCAMTRRANRTQPWFSVTKDAQEA